MSPTPFVACIHPNARPRLPSGARSAAHARSTASSVPTRKPGQPERGRAAGSEAGRKSGTTAPAAPIGVTGDEDAPTAEPVGEPAADQRRHDRHALNPAYSRMPDVRRGLRDPDVLAERPKDEQGLREVAGSEDEQRDQELAEGRRQSREARQSVVRRAGRATSASRTSASSETTASNPGIAVSRMIVGTDVPARSSTITSRGASTAPAWSIARSMPIALPRPLLGDRPGEQRVAHRAAEPAAAPAERAKGEDLPPRGREPDRGDGDAGHDVSRERRGLQPVQPVREAASGELAERRRGVGDALDEPERERGRAAEHQHEERQHRRDGLVCEVGEERSEPEGRDRAAFALGLDDRPRSWPGRARSDGGVPTTVLTTWPPAASLARESSEMGPTVRTYPFTGFSGC